MAEMLLELDDDVLSVLAQIFNTRLLNQSHSPNDTAWDKILVTLLRKKGFANRVQDFRPIASIPVLYKVYSRMLLRLSGIEAAGLDAPQAAF